MFKNPLALRALIVVVLTLVVWIPLQMVHGVVLERSYYYNAAVSDIAASWTGAQHFVGPIVVADYETLHESKLWNRESERYETKQSRQSGQVAVLAAELNVNAVLKTSKRRRGIYEVPVYETQLSIDGRFASSSLADFAQQTDKFSRFTRIRVLIGISDQRGIAQTGHFLIDGEAYEYAPGTDDWGIASGLSIAVADAADVDGRPFSTELSFRGSQSLSLSPLAINAQVAIASNWPHPSFSGRLLPTEPVIDKQGFEADWALSALSTNAEQLIQACTQADCSGLRASQIAIELIEPVDLYASVERAVKYGLLFILTTFVACFLTETLSARKLHPFHYLLVGSAQAMFFLLLVSFAEHIAFASAYLIALVACSALIGIYLAAVLQSLALGAAYGGGVGMVLGMLFAILRSEDYALLMGSLMLFAMLATLMITTRKIDWYQLGAGR